MYILRVASATLDRSPLYVRAREPKQLLKSEENLSKLRRRANALAVARHGIAVLASAQEDSMKRIITIAYSARFALKLAFVADQLCSKSTKVSSGQRCLRISSRLTSSPGRSSQSARTAIGWPCSLLRAVLV